MQPFRFLPALALIVACTQQDVPDASRSAQFETYPTRLFETFEASCSGPGETFQKLGDRGFACSEFLPPEATAFLILKLRWGSSGPAQKHHAADPDQNLGRLQGRCVELGI